MEVVGQVGVAVMQQSEASLKDKSLDLVTDRTDIMLPAKGELKCWSTSDEWNERDAWMLNAWM